MVLSDYMMTLKRKAISQYNPRRIYYPMLSSKESQNNHPVQSQQAIIAKLFRSKI